MSLRSADSPTRLIPLILAEWRHHPWRQAVAVLAMALGVALAWSVHVIHDSALGEFASAVRSANGQPDRVLRGPREGVDDAWADRALTLPGVRQASPVLEIDTFALGADGLRVPVRVFGIDALRVASLAPDLMPRPVDPSADRLVALDPQRVFLNASARQKLGLPDRKEVDVLLQSGQDWLRWHVSGQVSAGGAPLIVMDIAAAQARFGMAGRISRIDLRLAPGADPEALQRALPAGLRAADPDEAAQRMSNLSRAYRVNLTVLALVALFVGSFLVYSVVALSVAQRTPQLALLGVLGMTAGQRRGLILGDSAMLGAMGSLLGLAIGSGLAIVALRALAGDLGGGYFGGASGQAPRLILNPWAALVFGALGVLAALVGAWIPARQAEAIRPAQALKGLGGWGNGTVGSPWPALGLCLAGSLLALAPPLGELPLAAYAAVAAWLFGGVALVPWAVQALLRLWPAPQGVLPLLALGRARFQRHTATAAVAGVVAALALSVALTVMVGSFRAGVTQWLDRVLPADIYARTASSALLAEQAWLDTATLERIARIPGIRRLEAARSRSIALTPGRPMVTLFARELDDPQASLPMVSAAQPARDGEVGVFVSEAMVGLYGAEPGTALELPLGTPGSASERVQVRVRGVWRDYARQFGTIAIDRGTYRRISGDERVNDLAIWLAPGADAVAVQQGLRDALASPGLLDLSTTSELRRLSLRIFDRSFAVTTYLQIVAIAIGLVGIAASLSAQVLARRKEFGLLAHLGFTRRQVIALVSAETAAWLAAGVAVGVALGAVISVILVDVVNPQSFHWTMDIVWPVGRLAALSLAVWFCGIATAAFSARQAARLPAVQAVKEDW